MRIASLQANSMSICADKINFSFVCRFARELCIAELFAFFLNTYCLVSNYFFKLVGLCEVFSGFAISHLCKCYIAANYHLFCLVYLSLSLFLFGRGRQNTILQAKCEKKCMRAELFNRAKFAYFRKRRNRKNNTQSNTLLELLEHLPFRKHSSSSKLDLRLVGWIRFGTPICTSVYAHCLKSIFADECKHINSTFYTTEWIPIGWVTQPVVLAECVSVALLHIESEVCLKSNEHQRNRKHGERKRNVVEQEKIQKPIKCIIKYAYAICASINTN